MNNLIIGKSQLVEAPIIPNPAFGLQAFFADIPNISKGNIKLYGIEAYSATQVATSPNGLTVIAAVDVPLLLVTLVTVKNEKIMEDTPYFDLIRANNGGFITLLNNYQIDLTKCYVKLQGGGTMSQNDTMLFNLYYDLI